MMSEPDEGQPADDAAAPRPRRRSFGRALGFVAFLAACLALAIWSERKTLGAAVIDRKLAASHVTASYDIADLGLGRQRLVHVRIGDPARPDLTADWIEVRTRIGLDGAAVTAVSSGGLRVRASVTDGRLSLGQIERLLPAPSSGGRFRLPAIDLDVADARAQVTSSAGVVQISFSGGGRLDGGFRGRASATSDRLAVGGCAAERPTLAAAVRVDAGALTLEGPLAANRVACRGATVDRPVAGVTVTLADGFAGWRGNAALRADAAAVSSFVARDLRGRIDFAGSSRATSGDVQLTGGPARLSSVAGRSVAMTGRYRLGADPRFVGQVRATGVSAPADVRDAIRRQQHAAASTPAGPLVARASIAFARALDDVEVSAQVAFDRDGVAVSQLDAAARTGARASLIAAEPVRLSSGELPAIAGTARLWGGGLPSVTVGITRSGGAPVRGVASISPYSAGGAKLILDPVRYVGDGGGGRIVTTATLSGPLPGGRVEGLRVPLAANWSGSVIRIDPGCAQLSFDRLTSASLRLDAARVPVCSIGPALLAIRGGRATVGARIPALRLAGSLGASRVTLKAVEVRIAGTRFEARDVAVNVSAEPSATRLAAARLTGAPSAKGIAGAFSGAAGRIGKVPLLLSGGSGDWTFVQGALSLAASATVADASSTPRFRSLRADAIRFRLADGTIDATATLAAPQHGTRVADVTITHHLARGHGEATLKVPGLAFTETFQPDELTPMTFGVIADVRGSVAGDARIAWSPAGVTSGGTFRTDGLDLAAAFGPVTGLAGSIRFTDLLGLESAPDQVATVASINPGVPVEDGRIAYQLLPAGRVRVASGHWPFAGGSLDLQPTTLTFDGASARRLTFALDGVEAGKFLQQFNFANLSATGTFDGTLPMIFDASGGRIEGGRLRVRDGGGNLAYLGELTKEDLGFWGNVAFQALRSIDYRDLEIVMNGPLAGEMITEVRFAGISQGKGAKSNFLIRRLQKLPLVFNIRIRAPFRGLIDSTQSFYDPSRLISRNLPALIQRQNEATAPAPAVQPPAIQPGASDSRP